MSGTFAYVSQGSAVAFGVERIENFRSVFTTSGTLAIQLWATDLPYSGFGTLFGYKGAEVNIGTLQGGYFLSNVARTATINLSVVPAGSYNIVFVLAEWNGFEYVTVDYGNFPTRQLIGVVAPSILASPQSLTLVAGQSGLLSVSALGSGPLTYQWRKNGILIGNVTGSVFSLANAQSGDAGTYSVVVSNLGGSAASATAVVTVNALVVAPTITLQPTAVSAAIGGSTSFIVSASGTGLLSYQWRKNGAVIVGATGATLSLGNVQTADAASYSVAVTNAAGSVASNSAALTISAFIVAPSVLVQPAAASVSVGSRTTFSVSATGTGPLGYQWRKDGVILSGATSAELTLNSAQIGDLGFYTVVVSNSAGSITSNIATLIVIQPATAPAITLHPAATTLVAGSSANFRVTATSTTPLTFQWHKDGTAISGATSGALTLNNVQPTDAGNFTVVVGNVVGNTTSNSATLAVNVPAAISTQPTSQTVNAGTSTTIIIAATGTAPLTYQWSKNGASISGATNGSLTFGSVQSSDAGSYTVVVGNSAGSATSNPATLAVNVPATISTQPISQTVNAGTTATFSAAAIGTAPLSYLWRKDGTPILGATNATLTLSSVQSSDAAAYSVVITNMAGASTSSAAILSVNLPGRLINLSVLTDIATVGDDFTLGYVVGGNSTSGAKPLVIRAAGPSLGALGVPGTLDDPKLELFAGSTKTSENDNWGGSVPLTSALAAVGAFAYTSPGSKDAAATASITTRDNSVKVSGVGTGAVIAEIYDATPSALFTTATPRLINVSVRKHLGSGLTMGFVVGGATAAKVLVRGIGPTLGAFGVPGTVVDPQLTLFNSSSAKIGENNDWAGTAELTAAFANVGAFALPAASKDAALLVTLAPGNYTAQVTGVNGTTGVALVEVYEVP